MTVDELRRWLGAYFLVVTAVIGTFILLAPETRIFPMAKSEAPAAFQIIVPVLVGQLSIVYRWFSTNNKPASKKLVYISPFLVKAPPIIVVLILLTTIVAMAVGNSQSDKSTVGPEQFRAVLTFCVAILNGTTVLITSRYFEGGQGVDKKK